MKVTKNEQDEILKAYHTYWDSYLKGDVEIMEPLLADEYTQVGSAEAEVFSNKKDALQFLYDTIDQVAGKLEMRNRKITLEQQENAVLLHEFCDLYALANNAWFFYSRFRASTIMQQKKEVWKIIHQHSSFPDTKTDEGQNIAIDKIAAENFELRDAIKRRTIELEQKNKELEIEAALEKIRVRTMAMQKSDELSETAYLLFQQFKKLGETPHQITIGIIKEAEGLVEFNITGGDGSGAQVNRSYNFNIDEPALIQKLIKPWKENKKSLVIELAGKTLNDWVAQRNLVSGIIDNTDYSNARRYVAAGFFTKGLISISTVEPIGSETTFLLERFAQVFDQTYTRFLDLQKAEAQAREAMIELGLERVRARAMAMQNSDELKGLISAVFIELTKLDLVLTRCLIMIYDPQSNASTWWMANSEAPAEPIGLHVKNHQLPPYAAYIKAWKERQNKWQYILEGTDKNEWDDFLFVETELSQLPDFVIEGMKAPDRVCLSASFNNFGCLNLATLEPLSDEHFDILLRFAKVFDLTYTRFNDLLKAEAQTKEAKIEAALERTRTQSMIMQHSNELDDTLRVFHEQVLLLGIPSAFSFLWLPDEEKDRHIFWAAWAENDSTVFRSKAINYPLDRNEPATKQCLIDWKGSEPIVSYHVPPSGVENYFAAWQELITGVEQLQPKYFRQGLYYIEAFMKYGCFGVMVETDLKEDEKNILGRFAIEFERTYRRFLDLQKAEAQARESQIQLSLERVRASAMAMHHSDELSDVLSILFEQFDVLGIRPVDAHLDLFDWEKHTFTYRATGKEGIRVIAKQVVDIDSRHEWKQLAEKWKRSKPNSIDFSYYPKEVIPELMAVFPEIWAAMPDEAIMSPEDFPDGVYDTLGYCKFGYIGFHHNRKATEEEKLIVVRFANEFERLYQRFLDLQKAEAQARESQIQLALERVRARTMAMQRSNELADVAKVLFQQVKELDITAWTAGFNIWHEDNSSYIDWVTDPTGDFLEPYTVDLTSHPFFTAVREARQRGDGFFVSFIEGEQIEEVYRLLSSFCDKGQFQKILDAGFQFPASQYNHYVFGAQVSLMFITYEPCPEAWDIFKRFGKVFEQTYTRFLDLQKAEAQAREAQIELGLERVRARAMAMQKSDELAELVDTVFKELTKLDFALTWCIINIIDEVSMSNTVWAANPDINKSPESYHMLFEDYPYHDAMLKDWRERKTKSVYTLEGDEKRTYDDYLFNKTEFKRTPEIAQAASRAMEKYVCSFSFCNFGGLQTVGDAPLSEANLDILSRFGKVFDLTYTRFNDLKQAEAQAREAQIETALERVRSRTMAMQQSDELSETAYVLFQQFSQLGEAPDQITIGNINEEERIIELWLTMEGALMNRSIKASIDEPTVMHKIYAAWKEQQKSLVIDLTGQELQDFISYRNKLSESNKVPVVTNYSDKRRVITVAFFSKGFITFSTPDPKPAETIQLLERFAKVFEQTYTRFLDLQKAEAQARESQIEAALERVRSRTLAMQKSDELAETAAVLFQQLIALGIEPNRLYISIVKSEVGEAEFWITDEDGTKISTAFAANMNDNATLHKMFEGWKQQQKSLVIDMQGEELQNYFRHLTSLGVPFKEGLLQKRRVQDIAYFNKGFIGIASPDEQSLETLLLLERFAAVFNLTFTRFNDLKIAEAHALQAGQDLIAITEAKQKAEAALTILQTTQKQLIQSEKMASLGELTAGIAHEIQNPLNFVNNFSDVSNELLNELMEEMTKGNFEEVKEILNDVKQNLEKINHHGKRADAIVKGMLQHSRSSSGVKEPTDINALCDEYLRLCYHGLRAKDKSFNAIMKTNFDESIGNINIIPQDIGRVLLNLYNNAFYAVDEKQKAKSIMEKAENEKYNPIVSIITKKVGDKVFISVKDNGNGIPQKIIDKIFQPFFTTKPTGQGTGLGLSLSYDIIKAHGGEIKVQSKEGEGTEFIIQLPII